jgi:hypothetical protein
MMCKLPPFVVKHQSALLVYVGNLFMARYQ